MLFISTRNFLVKFNILNKIYSTKLMQTYTQVIILPLD